MFSELLTPPGHLVFMDRPESDIGSSAPDYLNAITEAYVSAGISLPPRGSFSGPWIAAHTPEGSLFLELSIYTQAQRKRLWHHTSSLKVEAQSSQAFNQILNLGDCYAEGSFRKMQGDVHDYAPSSAYIKLIAQGIVQLRESGLFVVHQGEVSLNPAMA